MITVTTVKNVRRTFSDDQLPSVCLNVAGGGYTEAQTANAMITQDEVLRCGVAKINGFKIVMTTED